MLVFSGTPLHAGDVDQLRSECYFGPPVHPSVAACTTLLNRTPKSERGLRAILLDARGMGFGKDYTRAIPDFNEAIRLASSYDLEKIYSHRGIAYLGKGDYDHAIADFDSAIQLAGNQSDSSSYLDHRGYAHFAKDDFDHALQDFNEVIARSPGYAAAHLGKALVYQERGDNKRAVRNFQTALSSIDGGEDYSLAEYNFSDARWALRRPDNT